MPVQERYFDIKRDNQLIAAGTHFWCDGCLYSRPLKSRSVDPRYCMDCFSLLLHEASIIEERNGKTAAWFPVAKSVTKVEIPNIPHAEIMQPVISQNSTVCIINPLTPETTHRGPKHKNLPMKLIKKLSGEGMGVKAIAKQLKEQGVNVHFSTISRALTGQRRLI